MSEPQGSRESRIAVAVDGSPSSRAALRWAVHQAELTGAAVDAVIAWYYPAMAAGFGWASAPAYENLNFEELATKTINEAISETVDPASPVHVSVIVTEGVPAQVILEAASGADLLVMGSRGHGGFAGALLGSVSQHCAHHAPCPIVIIRGAASS